MDCLKILFAAYQLAIMPLICHTSLSLGHKLPVCCEKMACITYSFALKILWIWMIVDWHCQALLGSLL